MGCGKVVTIAMLLSRFSDFGPTLRGSGNATLDELFDQFLEFTEPSEIAQARGFQNFLPVTAIAAAIQHFEHVPFDTSGMSPEGIHEALCQAIIEERACVSA